MKINERNTFILNEILVRFEKLYNRYISIRDYYKNNAHTLLSEPEIKELCKKIDLSKFNTKALESSDLIFNLDLDKMSKLLLNNPDLLSINTNEFIKQNNLIIENYKWLVNGILVNIDTLMNIFFKLIFDVDREDCLPRGLFDKPSIHIYKEFPKLDGMLDDEFQDLVKLHVLRNNIVHNDLIVDNKLKNKLKLDSDINDNNIQIYLPDFESVIVHMTMCLYIIYNCCFCVKPSINILEKLEDYSIVELLSNYCNKKNNTFYRQQN